MLNLVQNPFKKSEYRFFSIAVALFWLKTYLVYVFAFEIPTENVLQSVLLLINPIGSAVLLFGLAIFFSERRQITAILVIDFLLSFLLFANVLYERSFNDYLTIPVMLQLDHLNELGGSVDALFHITDFLVFTDVMVLLALVLWKKFKPMPSTKRTRRRVFATGAILLLINLGLAEIERPQLLLRAFDRKLFVKLMGTYNFQVYNMIQTTRSSAQRALADSNDLVAVKNFVASNHVDPNPKYFGAAKNMNVIFVSMESLQSTALNHKVNGEPVMPFLNSLIKDKNTFYFSNIYHQVMQGKTSDAEFLIENSLYPLPSGSVFMQKPNNTYEAAPEILGERGYTSAVFHGNNGSFWNRDVMYDSLGYDHFFDKDFYHVTDYNSINYGIKDKPFFRQSMPKLKSLPEPFYVKFITLTNHHPYKLDPWNISIPPENTGDGVVNRYFQTARYMDQALEMFVDRLKKSGLWQRSVVIFYGDHYGISESHYDALSKVLGKDIGPYEDAQLQQVPVLIHVPGANGKTVDKVGGQIDIRPTLLHLLGIKTKQYIAFGSDLLSKGHHNFAIMREGRFVTEDYVYNKETCFDRQTGQPVKEKQCQPFKEYANRVLNLSDRVVYGDLLRFYHPEGSKEKAEKGPGH